MVDATFFDAIDMKHAGPSQLKNNANIVLSLCEINNLKPN